MADIADHYDDLVTNEILNALSETLLTSAPLETGERGLEITNDPAVGCVEKIRDAVMAALAADRARRERHPVPPSDERVLTAAEAGRRLGLSRFTMLRMRQQPDAGGLPFIRLSLGRIGYRLSDIEGYLAARRVGRLPDEEHQAPPHRAMPRPSVRRQRNAPPAVDRSPASPR